MTALAAATRAEPARSAEAAWSGVVAGVPLRIDAPAPAVARRVAAWLEGALLLSPAPVAGEPALRVRIAALAPGDEPAAPAPTTNGLIFVRPQPLPDGRVGLDLPHARCRIDPAAGDAELALAETWWRAPLKLQQEAWLLTLAWLLRPRGRYALHASAVVRADRGLVLAGESGSGKTSAALSLIQHGWGWLADDLILLHDDAAPRLSGLARGFAFDPVLGERLSWAVAKPEAGKAFADPEALLPGRRVDGCRPAALLFPRVVAGASRLARLSPAAALVALLPASGGVVAAGSGAYARAQMAALGALVRTAPAYRLDAGPDIFGDGAALESLLAAHGLGFDADTAETG